MSGNWRVGSEYEYCPNEPKQNKKSDTFSYAHIFSKKIGNIWNRKSIEGEGEIKTVGQCRRENLCVWVKHRQNITYSTKFFFF
jgi:hypothetical protein